MNLHFGRGNDTPDPRMEAELTGWLRTFEPAATPIGLRVRVSADLRAEAQRHRRPLLWLAPAVSSMASLAAVVGIGLILLLAVAGANQIGSVGGAGTVSPPTVGDLPGATSETDFGGLGLAGLVVLVVVSALAGAPLLIRPVRCAAGRVVFGKNDALPSPLLRLRRPLRQISPLTWTLGVVAVGAAAWSAGLAHTDGAVNVLIYYGTLIRLPFAFVVSLRYQRRDRSGMLLLFGSLAVSLYLPLILAIRAGQLWEWPILDTLLWSLPGCGLAALCLGVVARSGPTGRPRPILAALAVGFTTFLILGLFRSNLDFGLPSAGVVGEVIASVSNALGLVAWFVLLWVGLTALRQRRDLWAWWLVAATGSLEVITFAGMAWNLAIPLEWWQIHAQNLMWTLLLVALLIGLRPLTGNLPAAVESAAEETAEA